MLVCHVTPVKIAIADQYIWQLECFRGADLMLNETGDGGKCRRAPSRLAPACTATAKAFLALAVGETSQMLDCAMMT